MVIAARLTPPAAPRRSRWRGFTLIELLIALVVVGILGAVAFPSFLDSIRKSRRSEAYAALAAVQQAQERWRANKAQYTQTLSDLNLSTPTASGYYAIAVAAPPAPATLDNGYEVTATAVSGTSQANDTQCSRLGIRVVGGNVSYGGCAGCSTLTYSATHACWSR